MWLARDYNESLYLYEYEPDLEDVTFVGTSIEIDSNLFPKVTFDNSPIEVELKIKK
jgi:hypothetical protein